MAASQEEQRRKVRELITEHQSGGWDKAWLSQVTPWDAGETQPPLKDLLESGRIDFPKTGTALVPGCGKGYDAICIAQQLPGLQTTGADLSPTAVALAQETLHACSNPPANVSFKVTDFFQIKDDIKFDLVYDYTFFQALSPTLRGRWGDQMSSIVKPGGYLIVLAWPLNAPKDIGPPWGIDEDSHSKVLGTRWEKLLDEATNSNSERHRDNERLLVWRRLAVSH